MDFYNGISNVDIYSGQKQDDPYPGLRRHYLLKGNIHDWEDERYIQLNSCSRLITSHISTTDMMTLILVDFV